VCCVGFGPLAFSASQQAYFQPSPYCPPIPLTQSQSLIPSPPTQSQSLPALPPPSYSRFNVHMSVVVMTISHAACAQNDRGRRTGR